MVNFLIRHKKDFENQGAESFSIHCTYYYDKQCSLEITDEEIQGLAKLGMDIAIDCVESPVEWERGQTDNA